MSKKIYVDIDETICFYDGVERLGYENAIPNQQNIYKINELYEENNIIHSITFKFQRVPIIHTPEWFLIE